MSPCSTSSLFSNATFCLQDKTGRGGWRLGGLEGQWEDEGTSGSCWEADWGRGSGRLWEQGTSWYLCSSRLSEPQNEKMSDTPETASGQHTERQWDTDNCQHHSSNNTSFFFLSHLSHVPWMHLYTCLLKVCRSYLSSWQQNESWRCKQAWLLLYPPLHPHWRTHGHI